MFTDRSVLDAGPTVATMEDSKLIVDKSQLQDSILETSRLGHSPSPFTKEDTQAITPMKIIE